MTTLADQFIQFALNENVLKFGDFKLKSGRLSPYFFDLGEICSGTALLELGRFYADAITRSGLEFEVIFGPAYKGIPLASITATCLHQGHGIDKGVAYNRKEPKGHGEGGQLVGASLKGNRVLILDDVITAGTAVRQALALIRDAGGTAIGVAVCFDREEKGPDGDSVIARVKRQHQIKVISIAGFHDLLKHIDADQHGRLKTYFAQYGAE